MHHSQTLPFAQPKTRSSRHVLLGAAALAGLTAFGLPAARAGMPAGDPRLLPPISLRTSLILKAHPEMRRAMQWALAHPGPATPRQLATTGGSWQAVTTAPVSGLTTPELQTDGTVLVHNGNSPSWYRLTPDGSGNYVHGTWSQIASLPVIGGTQYAPLYHATAVLPDGRTVVMGGEYNGSSTEAFTSLGAIYDPVANSWTAVAAPSGWSGIGDAQSTILANGAFLLASCCGNPAADAILDPVTLTWSATGAPSAGDNYQDEQGYELLPNKDVLTIDIWTNYPTRGNATNAERYLPASGSWASAGDTPVSLPDPAACGNYEIGPAVLRGDGTVVAFGGNTGCTAPAADPTAIYNSKHNSWAAGATVPAVCGSGGTTSCDLADAPAALLPNGRILFGASAGYGGRPTHFFEYTTSNTIQQVSDPLFNSGSSGAYYYNFVVLPTGQILMTDFSGQPELYTPAGGALPGLAPTISSVPATMTRGHSYKIAGTQFGGRSQGAYYGDDSQTASNYPIVRVANTATGAVAYARTTKHSTRSVAANAAGSTLVAIPADIGTGPSSLSVIVNGIASAAVAVTIK